MMCNVLCVPSDFGSYGMYGQRSQERIDAFPSADKGTSAGKFQLTRLKMAEMVETTQFRFFPR